jgi:hypothetical protein
MSGRSRAVQRSRPAGKDRSSDRGGRDFFLLSVVATTPWTAPIEADGPGSGQGSAFGGGIVHRQLSATWPWIARCKVRTLRRITLNSHWSDKSICELWYSSHAFQDND